MSNFQPTSHDTNHQQLCKKFYELFGKNELDQLKSWYSESPQDFTCLFNSTSKSQCMCGCVDNVRGTNGLFNWEFMSRNGSFKVENLESFKWLITEKILDPLGTYPSSPRSQEHFLDIMFGKVHDSDIGWQKIDFVLTFLCENPESRKTMLAWRDDFNRSVLSRLFQVMCDNDEIITKWFYILLPHYDVQEQVVLPVDDNYRSEPENSHVLWELLLTSLFPDLLEVVLEKTLGSVSRTSSEPDRSIQFFSRYSSWQGQCNSPLSRFITQGSKSKNPKFLPAYVKCLQVLHRYNYPFDSAVIEKKKKSRCKSWTFKEAMVHYRYNDIPELKQLFSLPGPVYLNPPNLPLVPSPQPNPRHNNPKYVHYEQGDPVYTDFSSALPGWWLKTYKHCKDLTKLEEVTSTVIQILKDHPESGDYIRDRYDDRLSFYEYARNYGFCDYKNRMDLFFDEQRELNKERNEALFLRDAQAWAKSVQL